MSLQLLSLSLSPRLSNWRPSKRILRSLQQDIHETLRQTHLSASWWMMSPVIPMLSVVAVAPHCVMAWLCFFHELCSSIAVPDIHPIRVRSLLLSTVNISERFRTSILDHYRLVCYIIMYIFYYILLYSTISYIPLNTIDILLESKSSASVFAMPWESRLSDPLCQWTCAASPPLQWLC